MKFLKLHLPDSFIDLTKGHVVSQIIGLICSILVAKIYGASFLGVFSVYYTATMILSCFNTVRLESILFLKLDNDEKKNNTSGLIWIVFLCTLMFFCIAFFLPSNVVQEYFVSRNVLYIAIFSAMIKSIQGLFQSLVLISNNYKKIKISKILFTSVRYFFQFLFYFISVYFLGLILGYLVALIVLLIYFYFGNEIRIPKLDFYKFKKSLKGHMDILKYAFPGDIINTIAVNTFPILLISTYGKEVTGNYFMAFLILSIPLGFLQSVVSPVFFQNSVKLFSEGNHEELLSYTSKITQKILLLVTIPLLFVLLFGEDLIVFFFKENWRSTGKFVQIFALLYGFRVLYSPISSLEEVLKKNHISLVVNIYFMLVLFISLYAGKTNFTIFQISLWISVLMSFGYAFLLIYFYRLLKKNVNIKTF